MKRLITLLSLIIVAQVSFGQLSGNKYIPGSGGPNDYADIATAIAALNGAGVGSGGVTFNVAANFLEPTLTAPLSITATGTSSDPIIFQKDPATSGANPLITAYVGTATPSSAIQDGMWNLVGSDYVTIDGIDLVDPNSTNPATMEYGYAMFKASDADGCQYNTIKNCVVTLSRENNAGGGGPSVEGSKAINVINALDITQATAVTPTTAGGTNSYNMFYSNTLQNCNYGIVLNGFLATTPFTLGDTGNDVGGLSPATGNSIQNFGGATGATNPAAGVRATNQWGVNISYNTLRNNDGSGVNHGTTLRGIYAQSGTSANADINHNTLIINGGGTTTQVAMIENGIGSTAAGNTVNINNNELTGDYLTATTGAFYGIYNNSVTAANVNINENTITGLSYSASGLTGTGVLYPIYSSGAATNVTVNYNSIDNIARIGTTGGTSVGIYTAAGSNQTVTYNNVSRMSIDGTGTASIMYGIQTSTGTVVCSNNTVSMLSCIKTTGTSALYGIYNGASPTNENFNYNVVSELTHNGTGIVYGIYAWTTTGTRTMSYNTVNAISGAGTTIAGIYNNSSSPNVFNNKIYDVSSTSTGAPTVSGLLQGSLGTAGTANIYNNIIGDIKAPNASSTGPTAPSVRGLNITTTTSSTAINVSFNTVYLDASSTGTNFSTCGLYATTSTTATTAALTLKDNIFDNESTPAGTGQTVAYQRSSATLTNYTSSSNNNLFYGGSPDASHLIFYDGTAGQPTIGGFQTLVSPRESASFTEDPNYVSTTGSNSNYLHINTSISTQIESGGITVSGITTDFDGDTRNVSTPDVGADEFTGVGLDLLAPSITFTPLPNTGGTGNRTLSTTITDATGVPTAGIGLPVLYWSINANPYTSATATYVSGNQYDFTFGSGVIAGDVVSYYIVAQDTKAPTPNIGADPSAGASGFTYDPPACSTPPTTPYTYNIVGTISGTVSVGTAGTYPSLTGTGGLFEAINLNVVTGNITATIISDLTEDGTNALNEWVEEGAGNYTLTIQPDGTTTRTISGNVTGGMIRLNGADRVAFDGRYSGNGNYLTFSNTSTSTSTAVFHIISLGTGAGATDNTIRNCSIAAGSNSVTSIFGIHTGGTSISTTGTGADNDNLSIIENVITKSYFGIFARGVAGSGLLDGLNITGNSIGSNTASDYVTYRGVDIQNAAAPVISQNEIFNLQLATSVSNSGIEIGQNVADAVVSRNKIYGLRSTSTSGYGTHGINISSGTGTSNITIQNNLIYDLITDGDGSSTLYNPYGIRITGGTNHKVYYNSVNMSGSFGNVTTADYSAAFIITSSTVTGTDLRDNIFVNTMTGGAGTKCFAIYVASGTTFGTINYNDYYVSGANGVFGYYGADIADLTAWQAASTQDANSISSDPMYIGNADLHTPSTSPVIDAGTPITGIDYDYDNADRDDVNPTVGAYEEGLVIGCPFPSALNTSNITATTADLDWTNGGAETSWQVAYGAPGFNPLVAGTKIVVGSHPYTLNPPLISNTSYDWYVRAICGVGDTSIWVGPGSFTTLCEVISTFPFTEDFNSVTTPALPDCFFENNANADGDFWKTYTTYGVGGTICAGLYTDFNAGANNDYLILPQLTLSGNQQLKFSVRARSSTEPNDYRVVLSTTDNSPASFTTELMPLTVVSSTTMTEISPIDLSAYTVNVWIAIHVPAGGLDGYYLYIDDIIVEDIPTCPAPAGLTTGTITTTTALLDWTDGGSETSWQVIYGSPGFNPASAGTKTGVIGAHPYTLNPPLTQNTEYDWYVRGICAPGDTSNWAGPGNFTTLCGALSSFPYTQNFDSQTVAGTTSNCTADGSVTLIDCWTNATGDDLDWNVDDYTTVSSGTGPSGDHTSGTGKYLYTESSTCYNSEGWVYSPIFDFTSLIPQLTFWYHMYGATMGTLSLQASTDVGATWSSNLWSMSGDQGDQWLQASVNLTAYAGNSSVLFRFTGLTGSSFTSDMCIDDFMVFAQTNMAYTSSTTSQNTDDVAQGATGAQIIGVEVVTTGTLSPLSVTKFKMNTNGSTSASDILAANVYYTGTSSTFATTNQFGSQVSSPSGTFYVTGTQALSEGTNYFWLTYDISGTATPTNVVDAECDSVVVAGTNEDPTINAPAGNRLIRTPLSGTVTVGIAGNYETLTGANGLFEDMNSLGLNGNLIATITTSIATEPGTFALNEWPETGIGGYTFTIKPATLATPTISGSFASGALIRFNGTNRVTIDGSNSGGTSRDMTITNTSITSPSVILIGSIGTNTITDVTVKNCVIINGSTSSTPLIVSDATTPGNDGYFDNILIRNNSIQFAYIGAYIRAAAGEGTNVTIEDNSLNTSGTNNIVYMGLYMQGVDNGTVSGNVIGNFDKTGAQNDKGIWIASGCTSINIFNNSIDNLGYSGTSGYGAQGMYVSTGMADADINIFNNLVSNITGDGDDYTGSLIIYNPMGIYLLTEQNGINVYNNSIYLTGNTLNYDPNSMSIGICLEDGTVADVRNNIIVNNLGLLGAIGYGACGIYAETSAAQFSYIDHNDYYVNATGTGVNALGKISTTTTATTLAAWKAATSRDYLSISADPLYTSTTNLQLLPGSPAIGRATALSIVTDDYAGTLRHMFKPTIGAYEYAPSNFYMWTASGTPNTDWNTPANWSPAAVPGINDDAGIPPVPAGGLFFPIVPVGPPAYSIDELFVGPGASVNVPNGATLNVSNTNP